MKLVTFNLNGIRSALNKGLLDWLKELNADVVCFQEIKLDDPTLVETFFTDLGYHCYWFPAEKKGYSGVGIISKNKSEQVKFGMNHSLFDSEGRVICLDFGGFTLVNAYFPSGTTGDVRQEIKYQFLDSFTSYAENLKKENKPLFICGDINICHEAIDIHNPVSNAKSSGFLPEERAWLSKFINIGFTDSFRYLVKEPHQYTWWSYRAGARSKNLGWRIDYIFVTNYDLSQINSVKIHADIVMSDHCPMSLDFKI